MEDCLAAGRVEAPPSSKQLRRDDRIEALVEALRLSHHHGDDACSTRIIDAIYSAFDGTSAQTIASGPASEGSRAATG